MNFTPRVLTTTQDKIVPKVFDNFLSDNFVTFRFVGNGKKWVGESLKFPVKIAKNTQGGSFSGLDTHGTDAVETRQNLSFYQPAFSLQHFSCLVFLYHFSLHGQGQLQSFVHGIFHLQLSVCA